MQFLPAFQICAQPCQALQKLFAILPYDFMRLPCQIFMWNSWLCYRCVTSWRAPSSRSRLRASSRSATLSPTSREWALSWESTSLTRKPCRGESDCLKAWPETVFLQDLCHDLIMVCRWCLDANVAVRSRPLLHRFSSITTTTTTKRKADLWKQGYIWKQVHPVYSVTFE